jgi:hypothetical protein
MPLKALYIVHIVHDEWRIGGPALIQMGGVMTLARAQAVSILLALACAGEDDEELT